MMMISALGFTAVSSLYENADTIEVLTEKTLDSKIPQDSMLWIVHLYTVRRRRHT